MHEFIRNSFFNGTGTMDNPLVTVSGPSNVNVTARFTAGGSRTYTLVLDLMDDENALEDVESLILRLENPSDDRSMIGGVSTVMITDEDGWVDRYILDSRFSPRVCFSFQLLPFPFQAW